MFVAKKLHETKIPFVLQYLCFRNCRKKRFYLCKWLRVSSPLNTGVAGQEWRVTLRAGVVEISGLSKESQTIREQPVRSWLVKPKSIIHWIRFWWIWQTFWIRNWIIHQVYLSRSYTCFMLYLRLYSFIVNRWMNSSSYLFCSADDPEMKKGTSPRVRKKLQVTDKNGKGL